MTFELVSTCKHKADTFYPLVDIMTSPSFSSSFTNCSAVDEGRLDCDWQPAAFHIPGSNVSILASAVDNIK